ncbi:hypothetical protein UFOVP756_14 [uncultured Caudovirales phage]|uniref:Uncharacterized protein n=1 Tax=uncultured Caudovirales phage TaxID=2100421 RepID=A0A6J7X5I0_9CAUD|nr:hypothetical protein UFOVP756_14 [uncultured Caudovirales phage]
MTINEIAKENYKHAVRRGKINENSSFFIFMMDLKNEVNELYESALSGNFDPSEAVDVILVPMSLLEHNGYDVEAEIMKKLEFNKVRD